MWLIEFMGESGVGGNGIYLLGLNSLKSQTSIGAAGNDIYLSEQLLLIFLFKTPAFSDITTGAYSMTSILLV